MTQEALKLALDALEKLACLGNGQAYGNSIGNDIAINAITAIKEALAQTQEPVAWWVTSPDGEIDWSDEPIQYKEQRPLEELVDGCGYAPLYTHPPQRTWVGLTYEERKDIELGIEVFDMSVEDVLKEAEAKLKEKNT